MISIRSPQDFGAGVLFILIGIGGLWFGRELEVGTAGRMGPGYFPMLLSWGLIVFGLGFGLYALAFDGPPLEAARWRSTLLILAAILAFALLIESAGLVAATVAVVVLSAFAARGMSWIETVALAVILALFCVAVFIYGLGQTMSVFG